MSDVPQRNQEIKANSYKANRREKEDRRSFGPSAQFPIVDGSDVVVKKDRRSMPDRRIANIQVNGHFLHIRDRVLK